MKFWKKLTVMLAAAALAGTALVSTASAHDNPVLCEDDAVIETAQDQPTEPAALDEEAQEFVEIAGTVACYNQRFTEDVQKANDAIVFFLEANGLALIEYQELEKKYRTDAGVQDNIKVMIDSCPTMILALPPEDGSADTLTTVAEADEDEEDKTEDKPKKFRFKQRIWDHKSGDKHVLFSVMRDGKKMKGNVRNGKGSVGCSGKLTSSALKKLKDQDSFKVTLSCKSGNKNSVTLKLTFSPDKKKRYKKVRYSWNGKINGYKNQSGSGTAILGR